MKRKRIAIGLEMMLILFCGGCDAKRIESSIGDRINE